MSYQDGLEDEVERLRAEMERLRGDFQCCADVGRRMEAEVERLRAEMERRPVVSQERLQLEGLSLAGVMQIKAERDRLRAVLAETDETLTRVACAFNGRGSDSSFVRPGDLDGARAVLDALRARAGEPTPADPRPLREIVHAGEPSADGVFFVDLICGHRIATRQRQGEYPCLYCGSGERRRPAP